MWVFGKKWFFVFFKEHIDNLAPISKDNLVDSRAATEKQGYYEVSKAASCEITEKLGL